MPALVSLQDLDLDLDGFVRRLDRRERMPDCDVGLGEVAGCVLWIGAGRIGRVDRVYEAQWDIATDRFVDGPQGGIDGGS